MKQWEQALQFAAEVQAKQAEPTAAAPGRYGLSQSLTHPGARSNAANPLETRVDALTHYTAGLGANDMGLKTPPVTPPAPSPAIDLEPGR